MFTTFFVDADAAFNGNGASATPFQTIQAAANVASPGDIVEVRGGTYRETVQVFDDNVTFRAAAGEEVILSGGDLITGWTLVTGDANQDGVVDSDDSNIWRSTVSFNAPNAPSGAFPGDPLAGNTLFVNGELRNEARQFAENDVLDPNDWGQIRGSSNLSSNSSTLTSTDLIGFGDDYWNGARIRFQRTDFDFQTRTIVDYDSSSGTVTFDSPVGSVTNKQTNIFYIDETVRALDQAGEWFKQGNTLLYKAEPGQNPNNLDIEFKRRAFAFDVRGDEGVVIDGFTFRGASIQTDANSDNQVYQNNLFYAYDFGQVGRFQVLGDNVVIRDNEFSNTATSAITTRGERIDVVNNYFHDIGIGATPTTRVLTAPGERLFFSHNTVRRFARSVFDGYSAFGEYSHNLFEDGGRISYDTGVFDSDGTGGNNSFARIHHNVFRNHSGRGIFRAYYGRNNNAVFDHNIIYNFEPTQTSAEIFANTGVDFRQVFHNTIISQRPLDGRDPNNDSIDPNAVVGTRYNNNLQFDITGNEALGVDLRGNLDYTAADFVDFAGEDFRLAAGSGAIDIGVVIPGINDDFNGAAPDAGAIEFGEEIFDFGHDFDNPPSVAYSGVPIPGTNLNQNSQFNRGLEDFVVLSGNPNSSDRNSFNLSREFNSLTGFFRTQSVEFEPGTAIQRTFTGLEPNTTYTLGSAARVINEVTVGSQFDGQQGSVSTGTHRGVSFVTNISGTDYVRYDGIDFGEAGQFDQIEFLHSRNTRTNSIDGVTVEIRVDSPNGPLLGEFTTIQDDPDQLWYRSRENLPETTGVRSIYVSVSGTNAANLALGNIRLLRGELPTSDLLTAEVRSLGGRTESLQFGWTDWELGYETLEFTTGANATSATVTFRNNGRINSYLDRVYLVEGAVRQGDNLAFIVGDASQSSDASLGLQATNAVDEDTSTLSETLASDVNSWWQVRFSNNISIGEIELFNRDDARFAELSNFTVSVWDGDPDNGANELWSRSYFEDGSVAQGGSLKLDGSEVADDGVTRLAGAFGRVVRVQLNGLNNAGNGSLALADVSVRRSIDAMPEANLALTGTASQSTNLRFFGDMADDAINGVVDPFAEFTHTARESQAWWQVELEDASQIGQIVVVNRQGEESTARRIGTFRVSVWDGDPDAGGNELWGNNYSYNSNASPISTNSIGNGGALQVDGGVTSGGQRLDEVEGGRYVRVQLTGTNFLSLAEVQVWRPNQAVDLGEVVYTYDPGVGDQVAAGATAITPSLAGDAFFSGDVTAVDRGVGNGFNRDFIAGTTPATFNHRVENGRYRVTLNTSDPQRDLDNLFVRAEGGGGSQEVTNIDRPAGQNGTFNLTVDVEDGELNLEFGDADTVNPEWAVNRIVLTRLPTGAPGISPGSGTIATGSEVTFQNPDTAGEVFYTTDGSDPRLPDGSVNPNAISAAGQETVNTITLQDFDGVSAPGLPAGWEATSPVGNTDWVTSTAASDGGVNGATIDNVASINDSRLTSAPFAVDANSNVVSFRNRHNIDSVFDGGILEISIPGVSGGEFVEIEEAGGSFLQGGYNSSINGFESNPLGPRPRAWSGNSIPGNPATNGWFTTEVELPSSAFGQEVRLRWRLGSGTSFGLGSWDIDSITQTIVTPPSPGTFTVNENTTLTARTRIGNEWSPLATAVLQVGGAGLPGDYNNDTVVSAADYVVFRDLVGAAGLLVNETASPGVVDAADFDVFVEGFGQSSAGGVAAAFAAATSATTAPPTAASDAAVLPPLVVDEAVVDEAIVDEQPATPEAQASARASLLLNLLLEDASLLADAAERPSPIADSSVDPVGSESDAQGEAFEWIGDDLYL